MDLYANKKIKFTKNVLTGEELLTLTNKHSNKNNGFNLNNLGKKYYSTKNFKKDDKYLSYITPIKQQKSISKIINLTEQNKNSFSTMDIETIVINGKELPISISIKTKNITKIFIIDYNLLIQNVDNSLKDIWDKFFDFILVNCNKDVIFVHNLGNFDVFLFIKL
jgi:hypothetical protein